MLPTYRKSLKKRGSDVLEDITFLWRSNKMIEKLGGKKFSLAVLILAMGFGYCVYLKVPFADFKSFCEWILGIFVTGNVGAYIATALPEIGKKK
jgi:hypothetical protein